MATIAAEVTGSVWTIDVAVGDVVSPGDTLIVLESMKMEIPVEAEQSGVVRAIHCAEGDAVDEDDVLIEIE